MNAPNIPDFRPAEESISWAKADIADFEAALLNVFSEGNYAVVADLEESTGRRWFKLKIFEDDPFAAIKKSSVGALMHLRNSFDQATNIAATSIFGAMFGGNFPWSTGPTDLRGILEKRKGLKNGQRGYPKQLWEPLELQQPYKRGDSYAGGNNLVRSIATLCNNKHSVGFVIDGGGAMLGWQGARFVGVDEVAIYPANWSAMKQEAVLFFIKGGHIEFKEKTQLGLSICLEVPELSKSPDVRFALNEFLAASERNLKLMKAACGK